MDASASKRGDAEVDRFLGLYLKIGNISHPSSKQKKCVIKYTRLPDVDYYSKTSWLPTDPKFRRIITIEEPILETRRSLRSEMAIPSRLMMSDFSKRKIVTIEKTDDYRVYPKFSQQKKTYKNLINKAIETELSDIKEEKQILQRNVSRHINGSNNCKDMKHTNITSGKKKLNSMKLDNRYKYSRGDNENHDYLKNTCIKETARSNKNVTSPEDSLSNKIVSSRGSDKEVTDVKNKTKEDRFRKFSPKKTLIEKTKSNKSPVSLYQNKMTILKNIKEKNKPINIIHVPIDECLPTRNVATEILQDILIDKDNISCNVASSIKAIDNTKFKDINVGTEMLPNKVDRGTEVDQDLIESDAGGNNITKLFDSLDIPNVSLTNNSKSDLPKVDVVYVVNQKSSLLDNPINTISQKDEKKYRESHFRKSTSYIISRATLTYTTEQKINFHVVGQNEILPVHVPSSPYNYPLNVVSIYKQEMKNRKYHGGIKKIHYDKEDDNYRSHHEMEHLNKLTSVNCSHVFDNSKLVKPSDIIGTIKVYNSLINSDYLCEQFQRELNFIDSFFESLQYLENSLLAETCITEKKVEKLIANSGNDLKSLEFGSFLSEFENEITIDDSKTMASKSLCLLNLLIRDEQRRAKNLLIVLKMREDALKDFTKSQILWLENKKKLDNIDISTLKKKQRGALLKLQHECGEMQRMRKTLLTLSEKRKLALMKTKKNIEIKLKNSVDVDQIILGKKKLKRAPASDRNIAPLKCFELSSSGCDDSSTSRSRSTTTILIPNISKSITSAEKCVQTGDNNTEICHVDQATDTTDEHFVVVDGAYLNILFHNLSLPQIFSTGKQYEVNKEALNNIIHTSNMQHYNWNSDMMFEELMDQIKKHNLDGSNTPSTARSLVEEFDQIYKGLANENLQDGIFTHNCNKTVINELKGTIAQTAASKIQESERMPRDEDSDEVYINESSNNSSVDKSCSCEPLMVSMGTQSLRGRDAVEISVSGPLPVPAGEAAVPDDTTFDVPTWLAQQSSVTSSLVDSSSSSNEPLCQSVSSLASPVQYEAEELRRQQLAIEREIKALEQQQCQLLAVREIPDKPPPPYTPPLEPKLPKTPRIFGVDDTIEEKIHALITEPDFEIDASNVDPFDVFINDFCRDSVLKQKLASSEKYWDTCNFPPTKPELSTEKLIEMTTTEFKDVLTCVAPTVVSGVGARRSDHIDDILFAEWRRCEPEWTSLHADEVIVKNQVFESIFQKILSETVDEYKKTVLESN